MQGTLHYDQIAGFFSFSMLEVAGKTLERIAYEDDETYVRMVCKSCLNSLEVQTAGAAKSEMHREWRASLPTDIGAPMKARLQWLYDFHNSGLLKVKVLPGEVFGLIYGKAGVITRADRRSALSLQFGPKQAPQSTIDNKARLVENSF